MKSEPIASIGASFGEDLPAGVVETCHVGFFSEATKIRWWAMLHSGVIQLPILEVSNNRNKCMVKLRDFPLIVHCLGW